jgi:hypothetical protein
MSKDAYFFPHDSNARHDPKILKMRSHYKLEGFGLYWAIIEMMREQDDYLLQIDEDSIKGYSLDLNITPELLNKYLNDCINNFNLFQSNNNFIWSDSLIRRMSNYDEKSDKARESANIRWGKTQSERKANALPTQSERINGKNDQQKTPNLDTNNANAMQTQCDGNASKVQYSKVKESIEDYIYNNIPDFIDKELFIDYLEMRTKKKIPNTLRCIKLAFSRLLEMKEKGFNPNKSIENSILNGWQGLFPPKDDYSKNNTKKTFNNKDKFDDIPEENK